MTDPRLIRRLIPFGSSRSTDPRSPSLRGPGSVRPILPTDPDHCTNQLTTQPRKDPAMNPHVDHCTCPPGHPAHSPHAPAGVVGDPMRDGVEK